MIKSALIIGIVALVLATGASMLSPLCVPCLALFAGLAAGYLAGSFEKPANNGDAAKQGALSGAIGGIGALLGQGIGAVITGATVNSELAMEQALELMQQWGWDMPIPAGDQQMSYWASLAGTACCCGLLDVALMAGLCALGGLLWWQISGKTHTISSGI